MIEAYGVTDVGLVRKTNEDMFVSDPDARFFAVADGMGGHSGGEVASRLAIEAICGFIRRSGMGSDFSWPYGIDRALSFDGNRLRTAIHLANRRVFRVAESTDNYSGMGSTIVSVLLNGSRMAIGHVGDSRLYRLSNGDLQQMTSDDSWAATILAQEPGLDRADLAHHPMRNVLTNVLGAREQVEAHLSEHDLTSGERLLLCSDGVHGVLDEPAFCDILTTVSDVQAAAHRLVEMAMERGSRDNVTALVVHYEADK